MAKSLALFFGLTVLLLGLTAGLLLTQANASAATPPPWVRTPLPTSTRTPTVLPPLPITPIPDYGVIILQFNRPHPKDPYTVVQWLAGDGSWRDVMEWRGEMDTDFSNIQKIWTVFPRDFGAGPFRWVVYDGRGGPVWAVSGSFTLPGSQEIRLVPARTLTPTPTPARSR